MEEMKAKKSRVERLRRFFLASVPPPRDLWAELRPSELSDLIRVTGAEKRPRPIHFAQRWLRALERWAESHALALPEEAYEVMKEATPVGVAIFLLPEPWGELALRGSGGGEALLHSGTTGYLVWEGASALLRWAIRNASLFSGRRVLELGAGTGLAGMAVTRAVQPPSILLTDGHEGVQQRLEESIFLNGLQATASAAVLKWSAELPSRVAEFGPEMIIGSDITFDPDSFPALLDCLEALFSAGASIAYLVHTVRSEETLEKLREAVEVRKSLALREEEFTAAQNEEEIFPSPTRLSCSIRILRFCPVDDL